MTRSEELLVEEELRCRLSSSIKSYNNFITAESSIRDKERFMVDGDRILNEIREERKLKIFHLTDKFTEKLNLLIEEQMKGLKQI